MSDLLPAMPSLARLTTTQNWNAAISVCQFAEYDVEATTDYLMALGLIESVERGYEVVPDQEGKSWLQAAKRAKT